MKIAEILSRGCIISDIKSTTKEDVIRELAVNLAENFPQMNQEEVIQILLEREKLGSTGIGNGIAIPHGKLPMLTQIVTAFGRSREGISFDSQDERPAHLFFVLLAPENAASLHLKALARLSRLLKDSSFRQKLMTVPDADTLYREIIMEDEK